MERADQKHNIKPRRCIVGRESGVGRELNFQDVWGTAALSVKVGVRWILEKGHMPRELELTSKDNGKS